MRPFLLERWCEWRLTNGGQLRCRHNALSERSDGVRNNVAARSYKATTQRRHAVARYPVC
jgi:hypothetical protein